MIITNTIDKKEDILRNLIAIENNISAVCKKNNIRKDDILLLGASKTVDVQTINFAIKSGLRAIGENRVQELSEKYDMLDKSVIIHFIGRLQSNKVKYIIDKVSLIHSVSSYKLLCEIDSRALKINKIMDVLIEINIANEQTKDGIEPCGLRELLDKAGRLQNVRVKGLMAIPPAGADSREYFIKMRRLYDEYKNYTDVPFEYLSMGMSNDYAEAIECGANIVRVGRALFGKRVYN